MDQQNLIDSNIYPIKLFYMKQILIKAFYNLDMEAKTRQEMLEEILQRLCRVKILHVEVIDDFLGQLKSVTTTKGDEESALLRIAHSARKKLKKAKSVKNETERSRQLRSILNDVTYELTDHINAYF
jgi:predicted nucleic-acid-binding protein